MDNEWNEVFRRNTLKKIKQKTKYEILNPNKKPNKYIKIEYKEITKKDYTLTDTEKFLIEIVDNIERKKENSTFIIHCECCSSHIISDIIKSNEYVNYLIDNYNVDFEISELLKLI